jgi:glycerol kinase
MGILVIDAGTSSVRAAVVHDDASVSHERQRAALPDTPAPGLVEFDASAYADAALAVAAEVLADHGLVRAVGLSDQRATTVVWDRVTGEPVAPAIGWQDLRTVGDCLVLNGEGFAVAPNLSVTKLAHVLDQVDPDRQRDLCFGTLDSWLVWRLSEGRLHVSDRSNAGLWGLFEPTMDRLHRPLLERLRIPEGMLPQVVDSTGVLGEASALAGAPPIAGLAGDQQASLVGQGCVRPGLAKATFGTGAMLDVCLGDRRPAFATRGRGGTFPMVCFQDDGRLTWGIEAVMLSAGTNVEWLRDDLGLIEDAESSAEVAARVDDTDGVVYVPALLGLGTPQWDYGARGSLQGLTRGTSAAHVVRAVLEGVAQRGADLVDAAETDGDVELTSLRVDGGMSANHVFVQALADATGRPVEVAPVTEATTVGAGLLAGLAIGVWSSWDEVADTWAPSRTVEPVGSFDRERWAEAVRRSGRWFPELSALDF